MKGTKLCERAGVAACAAIIFLFSFPVQAIADLMEKPLCGDNRNFRYQRQLANAKTAKDVEVASFSVLNAALKCSDGNADLARMLRESRYFHGIEFGEESFVVVALQTFAARGNLEALKIYAEQMFDRVSSDKDAAAGAVLVEDIRYLQSVGDDTWLNTALVAMGLPPSTEVAAFAKIVDDRLSASDRPDSPASLAKLWSDMLIDSSTPTDQALGASRDLLKLYDTTPEALSKEQYHLALAFMGRKSGGPEERLPYLLREPDNLYAYEKLAEDMVRTGNFDEAARYLFDYLRSGRSMAGVLGPRNIFDSYVRYLEYHGNDVKMVSVESEMVSALQELLAEGGYYSGTIDGKMGPMFDTAVLNLHRDCGGYFFEEDKQYEAIDGGICLPSPYE